MSVHLLRVRLYPSTRLLCRISSTRFYAQGPTRQPSSRPVPTTTASAQSNVNANVPHEVHEKKTAINAPFNSASGDGGPSVRGSFAFSGSPLLDAALTTVVGLGMCKFFFDSIFIMKPTWSLFINVVLAGGVAYVAWYKKRVLDKVTTIVLFSSDFRYSSFVTDRRGFCRRL